MISWSGNSDADTLHSAPGWVEPERLSPLEVEGGQLSASMSRALDLEETQ